MPANPIVSYPLSGGSATLPAATGAGQVLTSTGAGTTYTAQVPAMVLISKQVLASPAATVTFSSIPQTFTNLRLVVTAISSDASIDAIAVQFNADAGANYGNQLLIGATTTASANRTGTQTSMVLGNISQAGALNAVPGVVDVTIFDYVSAVFGKMVTGLNVVGSASSNNQLIAVGGVWTGNTAISSIVALLSSGDNFVTGSTFSLYGLA